MKVSGSNALAACAKRGALLIFDALCLGAIAAIALSGVPAPAYAYVDPSVMTYTIQAVAGVAVALSAVAGVAFRRSRKAIMKFFKIDENARKQVDPKWSRVEGAEGNRYKDYGRKLLVADASEGEAAKGARKASSAPLGRRLLLAVLASGLLVVTLFVIAPFEILAGNESSLVFGLADAWAPILRVAGVVFVALAILLTLLRGRAFEIALLVVFCAGLCFYIQALILNIGLPTTDGRPFDWGDHRKALLLSTAVWILVFVGMFVLNSKNRKVAHACVGVLAAALIIVQGAASTSLLVEKLGDRAAVEEGKPPLSLYRLTEDGMFTVSPKENVVVFVLDTFDTQDMEQLLKDEPEFAQRLQGFTWFRDSVGSLCPTRYGAPFLNSGIYPDPNESFKKFISRRYAESPYLGDINQAGYSIGLYTDPLGADLMTEDQVRTLYDETINVKAPEPDTESFLNEQGTVEIMLKAALYRDAPWLAKPYFYFVTDQMNQAMINEVSTGKHAESLPYVMDDARWYGKLKEQGLSFEENQDQYAGAYRFIHLLGTHSPYVIDEYGESCESTDGGLRNQARGSMRMTCHYLDEMKRLGVYDNATIIITADHGIWGEWDVDDPLTVTCPLMLAKPAGSSSGDLVVSDAEITAYDVLPTVIKAIYGNTKEYGATLFEQNETNRDRRFFMTYCLGGYDKAVAEYQVIGNSLDENNWKKTGNVWDPGGPM